MDLSPEVISALTALGLFALQALAKKIPDDATGILGIARKILKTVSLYIENDKGKKPAERGTTVKGPSKGDD